MSEVKLVKDIMAKRLLTVRPNDDVNEAFALMSANGIRHLPVVSDNALFGIISDRDLRTVLIDGGSILIEDVMVPKEKLVTVDADADVKDAVELMLKRKISCLPVIESGGVVGLLTETDLLKYLSQLLKD